MLSGCETTVEYAYNSIIACFHELLKQKTSSVFINSDSLLHCATELQTTTFKTMKVDGSVQAYVVPLGSSVTTD